MPSFDVVLEADMIEVKNAVEQSQKEIATRFDFKGTGAAVEQKERELTVTADAEFQLQQVRDVLTTKLAKRKVDVRFLDDGEIKKIGGDKVRQVITVKNGIESDDAKKIVRAIKDSKMKVQAAIQGESAHHRRQARRPASRHGAAAQGCRRPAAGIQQLPRLISRPSARRAQHGRAVT